VFPGACFGGWGGWGVVGSFQTFEGLELEGDEFQRGGGWRERIKDPIYRKKKTPSGNLAMGMK
jgi:hypothetical protein